MPSNTGGRGGFGIMTIIFVIAGCVAIYFLYDFLYSAPSTNLITLVDKQRSASEPVKDLPTIPAPFEGGDYSFSTWIYISSFNKNRNTPKHIFELQGTHFSTMVVGLGGMRNSVLVRTHTANLGGAAEGFQATPTATPAPTAGNLSVADGDLGRKRVESMFMPMASEPHSSSDLPPQCDLAEVDLQRWVHLTVVMSGRTTDVYLDGKLARSCVAPSYFKVDPTGVKPVICDKGGFDGYVAGMSVANYALNPGEIYRMYISGPGGASNDAFKWIGSLFTGA
jgi:hypothetical protein